MTLSYLKHGKHSNLVNHSLNSDVVGFFEKIFRFIDGQADQQIGNDDARKQQEKNKEHLNRSIRTLVFHL